jgi:hypothetical protein
MTKPRARYIPRRPGSLGRLYDDLNTRFFRARLPRFALRLSRHVTPHSVGDDAHGVCDEPHCVIPLARTLSETERRQVLLHEMCHIGTLGHDLRFRAKFARLATMEESWAKAQRADYEEACRLERPLTAQLRWALGGSGGGAAAAPLADRSPSRCRRALPGRP